MSRAIAGLQACTACTGEDLLKLTAADMSNLQSGLQGRTSQAPQYLSHSQMGPFRLVGQLCAMCLYVSQSVSVASESPGSPYDGPYLSSHHKVHNSLNTQSMD